MYVGVQERFEHMLCFPTPTIMYFIGVKKTMETTRVLSHIFAGMEEMCITYYLCMYDHICGLYVCTFTNTTR